MPREVPEVTHVDWIDYATGKTQRREVFDRSFLEHAAKTGSQYDGTCRLMAAHILALLDLGRADAWIPVGERLPEIGQVVHIATLDDDYMPSARHAGNGRFYTNGGSLGRVGHNVPYVTHWQPLPAPPRSET